MQVPKLICPMYDGAIIAPTNINGAGYVAMILNYANDQHGVSLATSDPKTGRLNELVGNIYPRRGTDSDSKTLLVVGRESRYLLKIGPNVCLPYAVASLPPSA